MIVVPRHLGERPIGRLPQSPSLRQARICNAFTIGVPLTCWHDGVEISAWDAVQSIRDASEPTARSSPPLNNATKPTRLTRASAGASAKFGLILITSPPRKANEPERDGNSNCNEKIIPHTHAPGLVVVPLLVEL
jgi:hypothetical protein